MRLDEWQKYIDSEFLEEKSAGAVASAAVSDESPSHQPTAQRPAVPAAERVTGNAAEMPEPRVAQAVVQDQLHSSTVATAPTRNASEIAIGTGPTRSPDVRKPESSASIETEADSNAVTASSEPLAAETSAQSTVRQPLAIEHLGAIPEADGAILPFADYISGRRAGNTPASANDTNAPAIVTPAPPDNADLTLPLGLEPVLSAASDEPVLAVTSPALRRFLQTENGDNGSGAGESISKRKTSLARRLLDPVLSLDETALLLDVPPGAVRDFVERGLLKPVRHAQGRRGADSAANSETTQRGFRLSDIASFLCSNESPPGAGTTILSSGGQQPI